MKKILNIGLLVLCLSLLLLSGISYGSPAGYWMEPQELNQLIENSNLLERNLESLSKELEYLKSNSSEAKQELITASIELEKALTELKKSKQELILLRTNLEKADKSLIAANQYLKEYEKEIKQTQSRLTRQRNLAWTVAGLIGAFAISK